MTTSNYGKTPKSSAYEDYNPVLNKYFTGTVQVQRAKTKLINEEVLSELRDIVAKIHEKDPRFGKEPIFVGSRYQRLMVDIVGDIDLNVVLELGSKLQWPNESRPKYHGFKPIQGQGGEQLNKSSSLSKDLEIVHTDTPLRNPGPGYATFTLQDSNFKDMMFAGDLIPFLVKKKFRSLLLKSRRDLELSEEYQLSPALNGPANTMETSVRMRGKNVPVSMDLSVIIRTGLPFLPEMNWPRKSSRWPPPHVVKLIQDKGINNVAQDPFHWKLSFAELEKDLVRNMDSKVQTCHRKVHRIMKSVFYEVFGEKPTLSTYMLKTVWLWECENVPDAKLWTEEKLTERYVGCLRSLLRCAQQGKLFQYFHTGVNLFEGKDTQKVLEDIRKISRFPFDKNTSVDDLVSSV